MLPNGRHAPYKPSEGGASLEILKFLLINVKVMFTVYLELHILGSALHDDVSEGCIG